MTELSAFLEGFQNSVRTSADADSTYTEQAFVEEVSKRLSEAEEIDGLVGAHFEGLLGRRRLELDGFDFGDGENQIVLAVADFRSGNEPETLPMSEARRRLGFLENFLVASIDGSLVATLEESSAPFQVATEVAQRIGSTQKIRLYLITNAVVSGRSGGFEQTQINGIDVEFHVWDLQRLERVEASQLGREEIDIDLTEWMDGGVAALRSASEKSGMITYLAVLPGSLLAGIYGKYGGRVLEANVRSFLTVRGNVNNGMKGTILQQPEMFLAYNNGIAATASAVTSHADGAIVRITAIRDLQIVNGGQTTASLFYTQRNDKADLNDVFVQMKLIVVDALDAVDLVPKISRYANTQNRISEADFFSNHPFHVRMEEISRRLLAPAQAGVHFQMKWFYERTRGQYLNERARLSVAQARKFDNEYPRLHVITKTDAAKYLVSWARRPHTVSSGAQKNFIAFANQVSESWTKDDSQFGESYFRELVGLGLLFNAIRSMVQKSSWYSTGYLANIVTYTLAKLAAMVTDEGKGASFDFSTIWREQAVPRDLLTALEPISMAAFRVLTDPDRAVVNVTEWAKRERCWEQLRDLPLDMSEGLRAFVVEPDLALAQKLDSRKDQRVDSSIGSQVAVLNLGSKYWVQLRQFGREMKVLSEKDLGILLSATGESGRLPSELQSTYLIQLDERMRKLGYVGN